ncbi:unnamed protein product, partial [Mesorhabditis belari]|uniref:Uncharacterized protein n=1 Tax=Mesorhabditis belari TaxID=2138241 RepID=A0AAF3E8W8_9BILA
MRIAYLIGLLLIVVVTGRRRRSFRDPATFNANQNYHMNAVIPNATEFFFEVPLDHFAYASTNVFKIRCELNLDHYVDGGPIFFYPGNEGTITGFMTATGIMWDLAANFNAAVLFAEHRYYGASSPFGKENDYKNVATMAYLTSEQALADYAQLLISLKGGNTAYAGKTFNSTNKVVLFGGSYGGMLAAWFRMKYPHLAVGAWASSAPLKYFNEGGVDWGAFDDVTTRTFIDSGASYNNVKNGWTALRNLAKTTDGQKFLNDLFNVTDNSTIKDSASGENLVGYVREAIEYMAMVDYPYETNFLEPMPGFPVKVASQFLKDEGNWTDKELAIMLFKASNIYYNYYNDSSYQACLDPEKCGDPGTSELGDPLGWPWQECTEIVIEQCARNSSFFFDECTDRPLELLYQMCNDTFGKLGWTRPLMRYNAVRDLYGLDISAYSNIILTQGHLDPWSVGGYKAGDPGVNGQNGIYVVEIPGSAHHLDLRTPNTCDGNPTHNLRFQAVNIIKCWLTEGCVNPVLKDLPPLNDVTTVKCEDMINKYPWGQSDNGPSGDKVYVY